MSSKRSHEGYFLQDNHGTPGVPDEIIVAHGLPAGAGYIKFESATFTCSHCEQVVVLNPDRSRARGYCKQCDHYLCDLCESNRFLGQPCYPYKAKGKDFLEQVDKGVDPQVAYESIFVRGVRPVQAVVLLDAPTMPLRPPHPLFIP
jgi:hypothetical protein